ncbi:MAG TPA: tetratricopeptide repeat protein [Candidatus Sumerlaeota bacterium]|nr:MAG: tetratricopeptide repeat protein [candidate division BRC1 bacterium ADurb.BinA292]HOE97193.1 tetratricopeptide repeat protein [Candidatus Sumerlaeota bacterium]
MNAIGIVPPPRAGQFPPEGGGDGPSAADPAAAPRRFDPWPWVILGVFAVLSFTMILAMWYGYRIGRFTQKAEALIAAERYAEAVPYLQYIVRKQPHAWMRQRQLAQCYLEMGQPEEALAHLELVRQYAPNEPLDVEYGIAWRLQGKHEEAAESFRKALARKPSDAAAHFYLGLQAQEAGRIAEAATHFQGAAADPKWDRRALPHRQQLADAVLGDVAPKLEARPPADAKPE